MCGRKRVFVLRLFRQTGAKPNDLLEIPQTDQRMRYET